MSSIVCFLKICWKYWYFEASSQNQLIQRTTRRFIGLPCSLQWRGVDCYDGIVNTDDGRAPTVAAPDHIYLDWWLHWLLGNLPHVTAISRPGRKCSQSLINCLCSCSKSSAHTTQRFHHRAEPPSTAYSFGLSRRNLVSGISMFGSDQKRCL